ncbi:MAG: YqaJ viral recombinase family protein [Pseudomonadota bacterium]
MNIAVNTPEWLAARQKNIGGSEVAGLFGLSKYTTSFKLYHQKRGSIDPDVLDNDRVLAGQILEPAIANLAMAKFEINLRRVHRYIPHPTVRGMAASLDYETVSAPRIPAEIKNVDFRVFRDEWEIDGNTITVCPPHIQLQLVHQMACTGAKEALIFVLVAGNTLYHGRFPFRADIAEKIERRITHFWADVAAEREPAIEGGDDLGVLQDLYRVSDPATTVDLSGDNEAIDAAHRLAAAKTIGAEARREERSAKTVLLEKLQGASAATLPGFELTMSDIKGARVEAFDRKPYRKMNFKKLPEKEGAA